MFLVSLPANNPAVPAGKPVNSALAHFATVRLFIQRQRWVYRQQDISGYQAQILVVKNKLGPAGKQVGVDVVFDDEFSEDGVSEDGVSEDSVSEDGVSKDGASDAGNGAFGFANDGAISLSNDGAISLSNDDTP